ncbi:MAG: hypothetical protein ACNYZH_03965 [Acidimicrobiia bacterium]
MSNLRERNILYARLEEVLGTEPAGILMNQFPTESDLATKADMDALGDRLGTRIDRIEIRIDGIDNRLDGIDNHLAIVDARFDRLEAHMVRFDDKLDGFHQALRDQTRTYMYTMSGVMASFAAVVVATGILT